MNRILEFLESINDSKVHQLKNKDAFAALDGKNDEVVMILKLRKQGLVNITEGFVHGSPTITGYFITIVFHLISFPSSILSIIPVTINLLQKYCIEKEFHFSSCYQFARCFGIPRECYYLLADVA